MNAEIQLSIIIPVRDEEKNVRELSERLHNTCALMQLSYEVIFVTDLNRDSTFELLKTINKANPNIKTLKLSNGFGHHVAVKAGLQYAKGESVVIMDGDLQDLPEDIPLLYSKFKEGYDVVFGIKKQKNDSKIRNFFSKSFVKLINHLSDIKLDFNTNMFRIISRRTVDAVLTFKERDPSLTAIISLIGYPTTKVLVTSGKRLYGVTKYRFTRQISLAISFIISFSTKPIKYITYFGYSASFFSFLYFIYVLIQRLVFNEISVFGWSTLIVLITFFGGLQLISIGLIGEYVGRIFLQTKERPLYIIEEKVGDLKP